MNPKNIKGFAENRLIAFNMPEIIFDKHWRELNSCNMANPLLEHLIENPTERDYKVAATIAQWLGSNVGQCYIHDVLKELNQHNIPHRITE